MGQDGSDRGWQHKQVGKINVERQKLSTGFNCLDSLSNRWDVVQVSSTIFVVNVVIGVTVAV